MNTLIEKFTSTLSGIAMFVFGVLLAALGFAAVGTLALFALAALGVAFLAAPFVALSQSTSDSSDTEQQPQAATAA